MKCTTTMTGKVGESYSTNAKTISGYTLKTTPANASGKYTESTITVTYVYTKNVSTLKVTLKANSSTSNVTVNKGSVVKLTASASGGNGTYSYKYEVTNTSTGKSVVLSDYSSSTSYNYTASVVGYKKFTVYAKDSSGTIATSNSIVITTNDINEELSVSLKLNGGTTAKTVNSGETLKFVPTATGGSESYLYQVVLENASTGKLLQ